MTLLREGFSGQAILLCAFVGAFTACVYDLLRMLYTVFGSGKGTRNVLDLCFCMIEVTTMFVLSLPVGFGRIRSFQLLAEGVGAAVYFLSVGQLTEKLAVLGRRAILWLQKRCADAFSFSRRKLLGRIKKPKETQKRRMRKKIGKT